MYSSNQPVDNANPVVTYNPSNISPYETSWRSKFPKIPVLILAIVQLVFIVIIFILEIASIAVLIYVVTGVGVWCAFPFLVACCLTFFLVRVKKGSRFWATITLIAQLILLIFTFILIGITGNYVQTGGSGYFSLYGWSTYDTSGSSYSTKYKIVQAQLAFGILLMFSGLTYIGIYIYVTIAGLWLPYHTLDMSHIFNR